MSKRCRIEGCTDPAKSLGLCNACYQRAYYWSKKPLRAAARRISQMTRWQGTLQERLGANVSHMRKRRAK